ncbi:MAG: EAL domain-containing protein [Roseburia sp.]|nr:EAL domain-containing protein [Roseburia sp.]
MEKKRILTERETLFNDRIMKLFFKIENSHLLSIIRRGLTMLVPVIVVGAVAHAILYFPNESFTYWITEQQAWIAAFLKMVYQGTFGMFSMILVVALAVSYSVERGEAIDKMFFYAITAIASFGTQLVVVDSNMGWDILGNQGCFVAMVVGLLSSAIFSKLESIESISLRKYTLGMDAVLANAIQSIFPSTITVGVFALSEYVLLKISGGKDIYTLWTVCSEKIFASIGNEFLSALLYTVLVHVLWILGFHGSHMMESVAVNHFQTVGENIIFSKSMFDTYVMMGGCGTTICVLIAIFLFAKKKRTRNIGKLAVPTVIFNANEILNFGIPIMLNPVFAIPFICVPIFALVLSYGAVAFGIISPICNEIAWTMPIMTSGYAASGIAGVILQIIIITFGVIIYAPFLKIYEKIYDLRMQEKIKKLVDELQECEKKGENPNFLHRMDDAGMVTRMLLQELKIAIRQKELFLLYQPQVDGEGKCIGAEALLRWKHPEYGFIYPPLIIYLAKEGDILPDLERMLFDTAISTIKQVSEARGEGLKISVNITAHSLNWELEGYIEQKLKEYQVSAKYLWIEITEQDMLTNSEMVIRKISRLKEAGHKLLIDDFGMGHTSLIYLESEHFDVVKLDGSLVRDIIRKNTNQKIVASVIELAKKLNIKVVAEYVETEEEYNLLKDMGCDWYQGYLFSKPISLEEFINGTW